VRSRTSKLWFIGGGRQNEAKYLLQAVHPLPAFSAMTAFAPRRSVGVGEAPLKSHTKRTKTDFEQRDRGEHKDTEKAENGFEQKVTKEAKGKRIRGQNSDLGPLSPIRIPILRTFVLQRVRILFFCEDSPSIAPHPACVSPQSPSHLSPITLVAACCAVNSVTFCSKCSFLRPWCSNRLFPRP